MGEAGLEESGRKSAKKKCGSSSRMTVTFEHGRNLEIKKKKKKKKKKNTRDSGGRIALPIERRNGNPKVLGSSPDTAHPVTFPGQCGSRTASVSMKEY